MPPFLTCLDSEPNRAWEEFYDFAWKLLVSHPPPVFRDLSQESRDDLISEIVLDCRANNFRLLRTYENRGLPFSAWLARIAKNRAIDHQRHLDVAARLNGSLPAPSAEPPERTAESRQLLDAVRECMRQLGQRCRLLLEAAADEFKPAEIAVLLGLPRQEGKRISDSLRACRKNLKELLRKRGFEPVLAPARAGKS